jgi:RHS repeat-associated protein
LTSAATDTYYTPEAYRWKVEFVYDGQGRLRIRRNYTWYNGNWYGSGGETRYLYDGLLLVQERSSANSPTVTYTRGRDLSGTLAGAGGIGGLLARSHGYSAGNWSSHNFYHADGNGNVTALVNGSGALQASYKYDPYGRWLSGGGSLASANGLRFSSKPWVGFAGSTTSGLYYYGYRFYDPHLQRWVNRDPIGEWGGFNLYAYLANNPHNYFDPYGLYKRKGKRIIVDDCEIVILYGHSVKSDPWVFEFPHKCSAGAAVVCWPGQTNRKIPLPNQIPGAPVHNEVIFWRAPVQKDWNQLEDDDIVGNDELEIVTQAAKEKAKKMKCCPVVTIKFIRSAKPILDDGVVPDQPEDIIIFPALPLPNK